MVVTLSAPPPVFEGDSLGILSTQHRMELIRTFIRQVILGSTWHSLSSYCQSGAVVQEMVDAFSKLICGCVFIIKDSSILCMNAAGRDIEAAVCKKR